VDKVQGRLSAGENGREKDIEGRRGEASGKAGDIEIVMRLIDRLSRHAVADRPRGTGNTSPHAGSELDLSGLDVPEREE
jgi:hypothetical protein